MPATEVLRVLSRLLNHGISVWLDGGWAVDALLGQQTREHSDLDIVIEARNLQTALAELAALGYERREEEHSRAWNFVLADGQGHRVDFHIVVLDEGGKGIYGPPANGEFYSAAALRGTGSIDGLELRCIAPAELIEYHDGYELDCCDFQDVRLLCERFGLPLPERFERFALGVNNRQAPTT